ncbi:MAG: cytochrome c-550 PedF [Rhodomicrobiaceae bacterium]
MQIARLGIASFVMIVGILGFSSLGFSHGDVTPQAVDTAGITPLGKDWLVENPFTKKSRPKEIKRIIEVGCTAYNQNCARCHGLGVVSGGTAPDLRYLEKDAYGDEWFISRVRKGYHQNGTTKMPKFEGLMPQEAMWALRAYINIRPEDDDEAAVKGTGGSCAELDFDKILK